MPATSVTAMRTATPAAMIDTTRRLCGRGDQDHPIDCIARGWYGDGPVAQFDRPCLKRAPCVRRGLVVLRRGVGIRTSASATRPGSEPSGAGIALDPRFRVVSREGADRSFPGQPDAIDRSSGNTARGTPGRVTKH